MIQNHWKKLPLLWALQLKFNCGTYPIAQLSSLKLSVDSQAYKLVVQKVFLFQMLGETTIITYLHIPN